MIDRIAFENKWAQLSKKDVYLACSGGVDSIVLLELLASCCRKLTLLHVNYNLRGEASKADEKLVRDLAKKYGCELLIKSSQLKETLKSGGNLQELARTIRFDWFRAVVPEHAYLALAHHEDDQIETFYQHLARKSGIRGLACMLEQHGNTIRPLLIYSKQEIYAFALKKNIVWREDLSNQANFYTRNKLRNEILPFLYQKQPQLKAAVLTLITKFQRRLLELENELETLRLDLKNKHFLSDERFDSLSADHRFELFRAYHFTAGQIEAIDELKKSQKGKKISSDTWVLTREKKGFSLYPTVKERCSYRLKIIPVKRLPKSFDKSCLYLDQEKIVGTLRLQKWAIGDRMEPVGMSGSKLISSILSEAQVENAQREEQFLVRDDQNIHWCVGHKVGRRALASEKSIHILEIRVEHVS